MTDLIQRLRECEEWYPKLMDEAADALKAKDVEIEHLKTKIERMFIENKRCFDLGVARGVERQQALVKELLDLLAHAVEQDGYGMYAPLFHQAKELLRGAGMEVTP